jgi:predicted cupin superfamily sugar epimerase
MRSADFWIQHLKLEKHPEGGAYVRAYTSALQLKQSTLPKDFKGDRSICTHIYFLLQQNEFSAFHRIQSDELWHFYDGNSLKIYELNKDGSLTEHSLGLEIENEQSPFCVIKAGNWFAAELLPGSKYALVGCTVAPGFDFAEFELGEHDKLITEYPELKKLIERLTK